MLSSELSSSIEVTDSHSNYGLLHRAQTKQALSKISQRSRRVPRDPTLYYWLMIGNGKGKTLILSYGPTVEPIDFQRRVPNLWSYKWPWLNLADHKTKWINMDMTEIFVGKVGWTKVVGKLRGGRGRRLGENLVNMYDVDVWNCLRTNLNNRGNYTKLLLVKKIKKNQRSYFPNILAPLPRVSLINFCESYLGVFMCDSLMFIYLINH